MKTTIVPAQITTVADTIAGGLTIPQLFLLILPLFVGGIIYTILPTPFHMSLYKTILIVVITFISLALAIRIKEKIILEWLVIMFCYITRPQYVVANKNTLYTRERYDHIS